MNLISKSFRVNDTWFFGPVMLSSHAMLMVINRVRGRAVTLKTSAAFAAGIGLTTVHPIAGLTMLSAYDDKADIPETLYSATLGELPSTVTEHPDWPRTLTRRLHRNVLFVMKPSVTGITLSVGSGLRFRAGDHHIHLEVNPFKCRSIQENLDRDGWL